MPPPATRAADMILDLMGRGLTKHQQAYVKICAEEGLNQRVANVIRD